MAARYRNNVSSKHYVHVRRKGCTGSTRGGAGRGGEKSISQKMYILVRLKCNPHAIPHADIKGAWRRPYWPCMTFHSTQEPAFLRPDSDAFQFSAAEKYFGPAAWRKQSGTWQNFAVCYRTFAERAGALAACRGELRVRIFTRPTGPALAITGHSSYGKRIAKVKIKKGWRLGTLVMAQIKKTKQNHHKQSVSH